LPFLQAACFFASLRDDEKTHFVRFSSESWEKHKRYFQPVCGKMNKNKKYSLDTVGTGLLHSCYIGERATTEDEKNSSISQS